MNLIAVFDLINLLFSLAALIILLIFWKSALWNDTRSVLFGLLILVIFRSFSNFLEWSNITAALDPFEDFVELLEPLWWGLFLYAFLEGTTTRDVWESKKKYKTLVENLPQKIFIKDNNSVYVSCNENYAKDLNIDSNEIVGKTDYDFHPHELADKYRVDDKRIMKSDETENIEEKYIVDGNEIWVNSVKTPIKNEDGNVVGIQGIFWDITERKEAEKAFHKSYEMFTTIMDSLDAIVYVADIETYEILFVNKYTRDIFGEVLGKICWETFPVGTSGPCDFCTSNKLVDANGEPVGIYSWEHYNDNVKHWYSIRDRAIRWIDGRIVRLEIAFDITKQKEDELQRTRLSRMIESSLNEIYIFDAKTLNFINVNEGALKNLGYTQEEMESMTPIDIYPELDEKGFNKYMSLLLEYKKEIVKFQTVHNRADGSHYPVEVHMQLIKDVGEPVFLAITIDITDRKVAEEKLKKYAKELKIANEKLKSVDRLKDEFLSNVSHELKTPLVSIEGYSQAMREQVLGTLNDEQKKAMDTVIRNADRLERLINSILYLSIEESGKMKYYFKPVQIKDVIVHSVLDMLSQAESRGVNINNKVQDNLPLIRGDDDKLIQVMDNLIGNAIKFTPSGEITITAREDGSNLHIEVSDTGVGIPATYIDKLFDRFYQGDGSTKRKYGGTGLGLHISKLIVEAHNGKIWAESEEGVRTTIHFTLPKES